MPRKNKNQQSIFTDKEQVESCKEFLREKGYAIFKADSVSLAEEEEAVRKLRAVGYKVEHINDSLVKLDTTKLRTVDDISLYFHGMMKRHNPKRFNERRLKSKKLRLVDHSVINSFLGWRIDEGVSLSDAIEDLIMLIDTLFMVSDSWNIDVRGLGILSVHNNKPFVLSLMNEVKLRKDSRLEFEVNELINREEAQNYVNVLQHSKLRMDSVKSLTKTRRKRKIEME